MIAWDCQPWSSRTADQAAANSSLRALVLAPEALLRRHLTCISVWREKDSPFHFGFVHAADDDAPDAEES